MVATHVDIPLEILPEVVFCLARNEEFDDGDARCEGLKSALETQLEILGAEPERRPWVGSEVSNPGCPK